MRCEVHVYDQDFAWQGQVSEYDNLTAVRRHLGVSTATFTAPSDLDVRDALAAPGARAVVFLDLEDGNPPEQFVSGLVEDSGDVIPDSDITYTVEGDYAYLWRILGWSVPGSAIGSQTVAYWKPTPTATNVEAAFKQVVSANVSRLSLPVSVVASSGRGSTVRAQYRFHPLPDRVEDGLRASNLGVDVTLDEGTGLVVDVYAATVHDLALTSSDGVIQGGNWSRARGTASRVVGLAQGEAEARAMYSLVDSALEAEFGFLGEVTVDARDTDDTDTITQRMQEALAEHAPKVSVSVVLAETADFTYGPYRVGDRVPVEYAAGQPPTVETITEATLRHSSTSEFAPEVTFQVGQRADDPDDAVWRAISSVAATSRDLRLT